MIKVTHIKHKITKYKLRTDVTVHNSLFFIHAAIISCFPFVLFFISFLRRSFLFTKFVCSNRRVLYALIPPHKHRHKVKVCDKFYDDFSLINMNFRRLLSYTLNPLRL